MPSSRRILILDLSREVLVMRRRSTVEVAIPGVALEDFERGGIERAGVGLGGVGFDVAAGAHGGGDAADGRMGEAEAKRGLGQADAGPQILAQRIDMLHNLPLAIAFEIELAEI